VVWRIYSDTDFGSAAILNGTGAVSISTNGTTYYVRDGIFPGSYVIDLPASEFTPFVLTGIQIDISYSGMPFYQSGLIVVRFQISGTATEFAWEPTDPVPYGNLANVTFYWGDFDTNQPVNCILGVDTNITVQSITQPGLDTANPVILTIVKGNDVGNYATFFMLLDTNYLDSYTTYEFRISIDWINPNQAPYYEDQLDKLITVIVRMRDTAIPQIIVDPVDYGDTTTIRLQYVDLDNASQLITGASLTISVLDSLSYTVNPTPVSGFYEIFVETTGTGLLGTIRLNLTVNWAGQPFFENQTSVTAIVSINRRVASMDVEFPETTPYLDTVLFSIYLQDTGSSEYINNNESFLLAVFHTPSLAVPVSIVFMTNGEYEISFDTTDLGTYIGTYVLEVTFDHSSVDPFYSVLTRNITGSVRERATTLDYEPVTATPYGDYAIAGLTYIDVDAFPATGIDSAQIYITGLTEGVDYTVQLIGIGVYSVNISTVSLGAPSTYSLDFVVNSTADWWFTERQRTINVRVSYRNVEMTYTAPDTTYYGDVTVFTISLVDVDAGVGMEFMTTRISVEFTIPFGTSNASVLIAEISSGLYNISFDTDILGELSDYTVGVLFYAPNYWQSVGPIQVTGRVYARPTQLSSDVAGSTPYLDYVSITLNYDDIVVSSGIAGATIVLDCATSSQTLEIGVNYWITEPSVGVYEYCAR
jgi:hypothetical protein